LKTGDRRGCSLERCLFAGPASETSDMGISLTNADTSFSEELRSRVKSLFGGSVSMDAPQLIGVGEVTTGSRFGCELGAEIRDACSERRRRVPKGRGPDTTGPNGGEREKMNFLL
jgi:hypothetical protein